MPSANIHEAKTLLSKLLQRVIIGEEIIIPKAGKPIAILSLVQKTLELRIPGKDAGCRNEIFFSAASGWEWII